MNIGTLRPQNSFFIGKSVSFFPSAACINKSPQILLCTHPHNPRLQTLSFPSQSSTLSLSSQPHCVPPTLYLLKPHLPLNFMNYYPLFHLLLSSLSSNTILFPDIFSPQYKLHSAKEEDSVQCILYLPRECSKIFLPENIYYHGHSRLC